MNLGFRYILGFITKPYKGERVYSKPIIECLDADIELGGVRSGVAGEPEAELSLRAIRNVIVQEFRKIEAEFKHFLKDVCKTEGVGERFDLKLSKIAEKIALLEARQGEYCQKMGKIQSQVTSLEGRTTKLDKARG